MSQRAAAIGWAQLCELTWPVAARVVDTDRVLRGDRDRRVRSEDNVRRERPLWSERDERSPEQPTWINPAPVPEPVGRPRELGVDGADSRRVLGVEHHDHPQPDVVEPEGDLGVQLVFGIARLLRVCARQCSSVSGKGVPPQARKSDTHERE